MADNRELSRRQFGFLALGGTIGAGMFISVGEGLRSAGSGLIAAYLLAAAVAFAVSRCIGELALTVGGPHTFVSATAVQLGTGVALVQGWSYWGAAVLACMAQLTAAGIFMRDLAPGLPAWSTALASLLLLAALNRAPLRSFGEVEFWLAGLKCAILASVIGWGLWSITGLGEVADPLAPWRWRPHGVAPFIGVLPLAFFAFGNSEIVGLAAAETEDAPHVVPAAINLFMARMVVIHVGVAVALLATLPQSIGGYASPFGALLSQAGLRSAGQVADAILILVMISSCNACIFGAVRAVGSLAAIGCAPARLAARTATGVPAPALTITMLAVAAAIALEALSPAQLLGLLLAAASLVGLANWAVVVCAHLRLVISGSRGPVGVRVPCAILVDGTALVAIAAVIACICSAAAAVPAAAAVAVWLSGLSCVAFAMHRRSFRSEDPEKVPGLCPSRTP